MRGLSVSLYLEPRTHRGPWRPRCEVVPPGQRQSWPQLTHALVPVSEARPYRHSRSAASDGGRTVRRPFQGREVPCRSNPVAVRLRRTCYRLLQGRPSACKFRDLQRVTFGEAFSLLPPERLATQGAARVGGASIPHPISRIGWGTGLWSPPGRGDSKWDHGSTCGGPMSPGYRKRPWANTRQRRR